MAITGGTMSGTTINILSKSLDLTVSCRENGQNYVEQKPYEFFLNEHVTLSGVNADPINRTYTTPSKQGTRPGGQGGAAGNIDCFGMTLSADASPMRDWGTGGPGMFGAVGCVDWGFSDIKGCAITEFSPGGNRLDLSLDAFSCPDTNLWTDFNWKLTLTDLTTTTTLLDCARPEKGGALVNNYILSVDPSHIYALNLSGRSAVTVGDLCGDVDVKVQLTASKVNADVPDTSSTLGLVLAGLTSIPLLFQRVLKKKETLVLNSPAA